MPTAHNRPALLIVDDQPVNIQILYALFQDDHEVFMATSGEQALASCAKHLPDLILLDVIMPGMDGYAVCRHLKDQAQTRDIPVIFVTGLNNPTEEAAGLEMGAVDYITKPFNAAVVRARVQTHLALRAAIKALAQSEQQLEKRVAERSAALESALDRLHHTQKDLIRSEAKATLSVLAASFSHELGTPLGNSILMANTLTDDAKKLQAQVDAGQLKRTELGQFLGTLRESTDLIQRNLLRAVDLVKNFRQVAADQASEQRRRFELAGVVEEVIGTLAPMLHRQPHRIVTDIPAGIALDSYPGPLGQIVINLINNAWLHAFEGRNDGILRISAQTEDDTVCLCFTDNGIGIPPENLEKLFKPFFSTKIGQGGTGLGMSIVDNLVRKTLGGSIDVQSAPNAGTSFTIRIPLHAPIPQSEASS